ncbi:MAG: hypothetical protein LBR58_10125 [Propionibacteriaceae bacterium]|nr:hypothetical protein [Propionibacteriaceae bacterium]
MLAAVLAACTTPAPAESPSATTPLPPASSTSVPSPGAGLTVVPVNQTFEHSSGQLTVLVKSYATGLDLNAYTPYLPGTDAMLVAVEIEVDVADGSDVKLNFWPILAGNGADPELDGWDKKTPVNITELGGDGPLAAAGLPVYAPVGSGEGSGWLVYIVRENQLADFKTPYHLWFIQPKSKSSSAVEYPAKTFDMTLVAG